MPTGTREKFAQESKARRARVAESMDPEAIQAGTGAAKALQRLEFAEEQAHKLLQSAIREGDPVEIRSAREAWLDLSDSLRRFDLLVARERRESGEMVQRLDVERHISNLISHVRAGIMQMCNILAPEVAGSNPADVHAVLTPALMESLLNSIAILSSSATPSALPKWMVDAATKPLNAMFTDAPGVIDARREAADRLFSSMVEANGLGFIEQHREATQPRQTAAPERNPVAVGEMNPLIKGFIRGVSGQLDRPATA